VLGWEKLGSSFIAKVGEVYVRLDPKHGYLEEWFPEVGEHLRKVYWS
jgi:hypothetical protein